MTQAIDPRGQAGSLPFVVPRSRLRAVGHGTSWLHLRNLPVDHVRMMLPAGLEPGPQSTAPRGEHPVLFMLVHHRGVRPSFLPIGGMDYLESLVAIPDLQWTSTGHPYRGPFSYMPRLFLNRWMPVFLGWVYAFPKLRERVIRSENAFSVHHLLTGQAILSGSVNHEGEPGPVADFPAFAPIEAMLRQPFVQPVFGGIPICSYLNFHFAEARIQVLHGRMDFQEAYLPGLSVGSLAFDANNQATAPGFEVSVPWDLPAPFFAGQIKPA